MTDGTGDLEENHIAGSSTRARLSADAGRLNSKRPNGVERGTHQTESAKLQQLTTGWEQITHCAGTIHDVSLSEVVEELNEVEQCPLHILGAFHAILLEERNSHRFLLGRRLARQCGQKELLNDSAVALGTREQALDTAVFGSQDAVVHHWRPHQHNGLQRRRLWRTRGSTTIGLAKGLH